MRKILGLCGYPRSGKNEAAKALVAVGWRQMAFADPLREMLFSLNPMIDKDSYRVADIVDSIGWDRAKVVYPEIRELLQRLGTEAVRNVLGENTWVEAFEKRLRDDNFDVVVTDVRFPNEAESIKRLGGKLLFIEREGCRPPNGHVSEHHYSSLGIDGTISNNGNCVKELHAMILELAGVTNVPVSA